LWHPAGLCLGAIIIFDYVNDTSNAVPSATVKLFADDANLFITRSLMPDLVVIANKYSNNLNSWLVANRLKFKC
jgi:hypothetical protein